MDMNPFVQAGVVAMATTHAAHATEYEWVQGRTSSAADATGWILLTAFIHVGGRGGPGGVGGSAHETQFPVGTHNLASPRWQEVRKSNSNEWVYDRIMARQASWSRVPRPSAA